MIAVECPSTSYGWAGLGFIVVVFVSRFAFWLTDHRGRKHARYNYEDGEVTAELEREKQRDHTQGFATTTSPIRDAIRKERWHAGWRKA